MYRAILQQIELNGAAAVHDPTSATGPAEKAANLRALGQAALYGAEYDLQLDENADTEQRNAANARVKNIITSASAGLTAIPHPAAIALGAAGTAAVPWMLSPETASDTPFRPPPQTVGGATPTDDSIVLMYGTLSQVAQPGEIVGDPSWYEHTGSRTLKPLDQIVAEHHGDPENLLAAMSTAVRDQFPGHSPQRNLVADLQHGTYLGSTHGRWNFDPTDPDSYERMIVKGRN
ncbi:hypothetical protein [Gordonia sp. NPDC003376]